MTLIDQAKNTPINESVIVDYTKMGAIEAANLSSAIVNLNHTWRCHPIDGQNIVKYERVK